MQQINYKSIYQTVSSVVFRWAMSFAEAELLMRYAAKCKGDHLEIGTLWGGSAIGVALAKKKGEVYCIDPFNKKDRVGKARKQITIEAVEENIEQFGIKTIHLYKQKHPPMPKSLKDHRFDTALIDARHTYEACLANWLDVKKRVDKYIMFHDIDFENRVKPVWEMAQADPEWEYVEEAEDMGAVRRISVRD